MPYCPQCGVDNPANARFCDQCGAALIAVPTPAASAPTSPVAPTPVQAAVPMQPASAAPAVPATAGTLICPQCGAAAIPGEAFCDNCGAPLNAPARPAAPVPQPPYSAGVPPQPAYPPPQPASYAPQAPAPAYPPVPPPVPVPPAPAPYTPPRAALAPARLIVAATGVAVPLPAAAQAVIGRGDAVSNFYPDIDLTPYGALDNGVGRRHARLAVQAGQVVLEDLDSTNGTLLNGQKLAPRQPQPLREGDQLVFGKLQLRYSEV